MDFRTIYKSTVLKELQRLPKEVALKIFNNIENALISNPYTGISLKGKMIGLYRYRIGSYRVIYSIHDDIVLILKIAHRKKAYR